MITINPADSVPIWKQIEHEIRRLVALGRLEPGSPVPSVRELSQELRVNPGTVQKAYQRLCDEGLLAVRRGEGTFVEGAASRLPAKERRKQLREAAVRYASLAATIGADPEEAKEIVSEKIERVMEDRNE